jgi:hypothetical protein
MPKVNFETLPDEARVWVFAADRPLDGPEAGRLLDTVDAFLDGWKAHGAPLTCARDWRYERFLIVGVDERTAPPSGCSIDALVRSLKGLESELGLTLLDNSPVWFRHQGELRRADRAAFRALARAGEVGPDTVIFDNTLTRLEQLRRGGWERPARDSWHGRAFFPTAV